MADIASSDVTYTEQDKSIHEGSGYREFLFKVQYGNSTLTYPAGGIPLLKASLGCPNVIKKLMVYDADDGDGIVVKYDAENNKLRLYRVAAHAHDVLIKGGQAAASTAAVAHYATNIMGKEAATDATITGADSATKGGVQSLSQGSLVEVSSGSYAPAATVLYVSVVGW
jgi:hypothetical protein